MRVVVEERRGEEKWGAVQWRRGEDGQVKLWLLVELIGSLLLSIVFVNGA